MKIAAIIPARYGSSRFPGKPLSKLSGRFLIQHVIDRALEARAAGSVDEVLVATDDARIARASEEAGARAVMTRADHPTGTDRIAEAAAKTDAEVIVNIQGDEPLLPPEIIPTIIAPFREDAGLRMASLKGPVTGPEVFHDRNQGKVVCDAEDYAVTFTRLPIPEIVPGAAYFNQVRVEEMAEFGILRVWRTIGIYAYRREFLDVFAKLPPTPFEKREHLEQLRALEHGVAMKVPTTHYTSIEVNVPEDIPKAEEALLRAKRGAGAGGVA
ncbi:MAG: 3-deoxy-D-manno-octulosonate cytidylyltransferase [Deltaproteobacteria bacterium RBG_13_65_10]|nr:MAG: 3-deoxy-D-manno-octulosonate cytidylyltransferase [Deltaproteobacteria bacterium RBG_13_65_10]